MLTHEGASNQLTYATDIIKEIKEDVKNQPKEERKNLFWTLLYYLD